jgi:hypothetical protein
MIMVDLLNDGASGDTQCKYEESQICRMGILPLETPDLTTQARPLSRRRWHQGKIIGQWAQHGMQADILVRLKTMNACIPAQLRQCAQSRLCQAQG